MEILLPFLYVSIPIILFVFFRLRRGIIKKVSLMPSGQKFPTELSKDTPTLTEILRGLRAFLFFIILFLVYAVGRTYLREPYDNLMNKIFPKRQGEQVLQAIDSTSNNLDTPIPFTDSTIINKGTVQNRDTANVEPTTKADDENSSGNDTSVVYLKARVTAEKAFFYDKPEYGSVQSVWYVERDEIVSFGVDRGDFVYCVYTRPDGVVQKGWMFSSEIEKIQK